MAKARIVIHTTQKTYSYAVEMEEGDTPADIFFECMTALSDGEVLGIEVLERVADSGVVTEFVKKHIVIPCHAVTSIEVFADADYPEDGHFA